MLKNAPAVDRMKEAFTHGRICALAAECQRDLQECVANHRELLPERPFDARFLSAIAMANAFGSPWREASGIRVAARTSMWISAADWLVDYVAKSRAEVDEFVRSCLAVADGAAPAAPLARFLAELRAELAAGPAFGRFARAWAEEVRRYALAEAREWDWKAALRAGETDRLPGIAEYLANSDNYGTTLVNVSHWIAGGDERTLCHLDRLTPASRLVGRVLRLLNDLASYERDLRWGDINVLMLGVSRSEVSARLDELVQDCRGLLAPLREACPEAVEYLERQIGYSAGFYGITDYWGEP